MQRNPTSDRRTFLKSLSLAAVAGTTAGAQAQAAHGPSLKDLHLQLRAVEAMLRTQDDALRPDALARLDLIARDLPEARDLLSLRQLFEPHGSVYRPTVTVDAGQIHDACVNARALAIAYRDRNGDTTRRIVLPIDVVHPGQGSLLLAYCTKREAFRKFYLHRIQALRQSKRQFAAHKAELTAQLLAEETEARYGDV